MKPNIFSGIDLVEISRFRHLNPAIREKFFIRVFTEDEREYIAESFPRAAGIFAAKEAVAKALGCGIGPISWQEIKITHNTANQPAVVLVGNAMEKAQSLNIEKWSISITHTKDAAAAIAIAI